MCILLKLVREWEHYFPQKYDIFQRDNLAVNWLKTGDGSHFAKSHIESAGLHKLQADCLAVIRDYSRGTIVRYVNIFLRIFLTPSKPQIESKFIGEKLKQKKKEKEKEKEEEEKEKEEEKKDEEKEEKIEEEE
jgi:hypothetical protein